MVPFGELPVPHRVRGLTNSSSEERMLRPGPPALEAEPQEILQPTTPCKHTSPHTGTGGGRRVREDARGKEGEQEVRLASLGQRPPPPAAPPGT